jgi:hypothetical protein
MKTTIAFKKMFLGQILCNVAAGNALQRRLQAVAPLLLCSTENAPFTIRFNAALFPLTHNLPLAIHVLTESQSQRSIYCYQTGSRGCFEKRHDVGDHI